MAMLAGSAGAAEFTWLGSPTTFNQWSNIANWENFAAPPTNGVNTDVFMKGPGGGSFGGGYHIDSLTFHSAATGIWEVGGTLTVDSFIRNNDTNTHHFTRSIKLGDQSLTITAAAGDLKLDSDSFLERGAIHFTQNDSTLIVNGGRSVFFEQGRSFFREAFITNAQVTIYEGTLVQLASNSTDVTRWNVVDGDLRLASASTLATDTTVDLGADGTLDLDGFSTTIGQLTGSGSVSLGPAGFLTVGRSSNFSYTGVISGTGGLTKSGSGTFTVSGDNTFTAATSILEGTLRMGLGGSLASDSIFIASGATFDLSGTSLAAGAILGAGTVQLAGATLTLNEASGVLRSYAGNILGPGTLVKTGGHTLALTGVNTFSTLQINDGVVRIGNVGALGSGSISIGNSILHTTATLTSSRPITLNSSNSTLLVDIGTTLTQNGVISGGGGLNKLGTGTLVLGGNNSYSGNTTIAGTLRLGAANRIGNSSGVVLSPNATLDMNNFSDTIAFLSGPGGAVNSGASGALTVNANSGTFTFGGQLLGGGFINKSGNHTLVLSGASPLTGTMNILDGTLRFAEAGSMHESTNVTVSSGATWDLNGASDTVASISGGGDILLRGATLAVVENSTTRTFSGDISGIGSFGTGDLVKGGTHTLVLSGNNTYEGTTWLANGVLRVGSSGNLGGGNLLFDNGTLNTTASFTNSRPVVINDAATFDVNAATTLTQTGLINGPSTATLIKEGGGTMAIEGDQAVTFSGDVTVNAGTMELGPGNVLGNSTTVELVDGATLLVTQTEGFGGLIGSGGDVVIAAGQILEVGFNNANAAFGGDISASGSFWKAGTGILTISGDLTYGGATRINGGTLRRSGGSGLPNATDLHIVAGAVYDLNNSSDTIDALTGEGSVTLGANLVFKTLTIGSVGGDGTFSGVISGTLGHLAKTGIGTQVLSGNNTYSQTFFNGGVLSTGASANLGSGQLNFNGGTWQVTGSFTNSRNIAIGAASSGTIDVPLTHTLTHTGSVSGILVTLNKIGDGTLVLSGSASPATMNVNTGVLRLAGGSGLAAGTNVNVAMGAAWDLNGVNDTVATIGGAGAIQLNDLASLTVGGNSGNSTFLGALSGTGALVKTGSHQLTLSGDMPDYAGQINVNAGTLLVNGDASSAPVTVDAGGTLGGDGAVANVVNAGRVSPGASPGILNIFGDFTQHADGVLVIELGGQNGAGIEYDQLAVRGGGAGSLGGTLDVSLINGFTPEEGDSFAILTGAVSGEFSARILPSLAAGLGWDIDYQSDAVRLSVLALPTFTADFNGDGDVDGDDLNQWQADFGLNSLSDADNDGDSDGADFLAWQRQLGSGLPAPSQPVPEPGGLLLLLVSGLAFTTTRQRR